MGSCVFCGGCIRRALRSLSHPSSLCLSLVLSRAPLTLYLSLHFLPLLLLLCPPPAPPVVLSRYSLLEIEHCILRGRSSRPRAPISGLFLPDIDTKNIKWRFAPPEADCRVNFILNYGTESSPAEVPVFDYVFDSELHGGDAPDGGGFSPISSPVSRGRRVSQTVLRGGREETEERLTLNAQLDRASSRYLDQFMVVDMERRAVVLPKLLDW